MIKKIAMVSVMIFGSIAGMPLLAATSSDINKLTTYATILGRAIACGVKTDREMKRVSTWMDRRFPPGSSDQKIYLPIFIIGMEQNAKNQANGSSPDSCRTVRREYAKIPWP